MRHIGIILAACALMTADLSAKDHRSGWSQEQERTSRPLSEWLPSVFRSRNDAETSPSDPEPATAEPAAPPRQQQRRRTAAQPKPEPEPEPKLTPDQQEAEDRWWKEAGTPAVSAFSRCLADYAADETRRGSQSSYPDFVTAAMKGRCSGEFGTMAQLILDHHGEDKFAKIARELIATTFVPAVKQAVEGGPPQVIEPVDGPAALEAELRQSKDVMFGCFKNESDRLAFSSPASPERIADMVIASCQSSAEAYFHKIEQLYPGTMTGEASEASAAILDASYRPAIVQRIDAVRSDSEQVDRARPDRARADRARADRARPDTP